MCIRDSVYVEAQIGEGGGDDFGPAVVAILAHLGHQDARPSPLDGGEVVGHPADAGDVVLLAELGAVDAGNGSYHGFVRCV